MLRIASLPGSAAAAAIYMSTSIFTPANAAGSPLGVWIDDKGRGAVEITECNGALCGKVVWVKSKSDTKGCGAQILGGVKRVGRGGWDNGWIYSPDHGRKFDVALTPVGNDRLRVTGYTGIKLFSEDRTWTRAPADLPRCDTAEVNAGTKAPQAPVATTKATASTPPAQVAANEPIIPPSPRPASSPALRMAKQDPAQDEADANAATAPTDGAAPSTATANDDTAENASPNANGLSFDKFLKKTADGSCKLDLPWVKIKFDCKKL